MKSKNLKIGELVVIKSWDEAVRSKHVSEIAYLTYSGESIIWKDGGPVLLRSECDGLRGIRVITDIIDDGFSVEYELNGQGWLKSRHALRKPSKSELDEFIENNVVNY